MSRPGTIALLTHIIGVDRLPEIRLYMNGDDHVGAICAFQPLLHIGSDAVGMVDSDTRIDTLIWKSTIMQLPLRREAK